MTDQSSSLASESLRPLALLALGRTGADIERLVRDVRRTLRRERRTMVWADLEAVLRSGHTRMSDDLRWRASVHEAGHALVYALTGIAEIKMASVGLHGVGVVATVANDRLPETETWLMNSMAALLAGRAAELVVLGDALAGAGGAAESDLARATGMALAAETALGFSRHRPLLYRPSGMAANMLGLDQQLAGRVNDRLEAAEAIARQLIEDHRDVHSDIAEKLRSVGILSGDELGEMIANIRQR
ncbi:ATP-dependent Zn protease [Ciceribacter sp. L1K23]|uniref:ATP-dependent Zn protease n=1 Tax=Ciceribacter sp. L1K23 TaxID=2820276 RepID=UPI001B81B707|nr:ATP-dependent Zn protease [Ciceribacter sp. L1K23]MBR0554338.1 ATP-dependent Zn protease [Ciceribacter sp. L1K23]